MAGLRLTPTKNIPNLSQPGTWDNYVNLVANLHILNEQMRMLNGEAVVLNMNLAASNERLKQLDHWG